MEPMTGDARMGIDKKWFGVHLLLREKRIKLKK